MAGLKDEVYHYKLIRLVGPYCLAAPLFVLSGIGEKSARDFVDAGLVTVGEIIKVLSEHLPEASLEPPGKAEILDVFTALGIGRKTASRAATALQSCDYFKTTWVFSSSNRKYR